MTPDSRIADAPMMNGKLYFSDGHLRVDWGDFADIFDLQQRKGWRIIPSAKTYTELGDKDLSTYAPQMTDGSPCPHAEIPSACKLVGVENVAGRTAKKWDLWNPRGFHVYFWTDQATNITLRFELGGSTYVAKDLRESAVDGSLFQLPAGYERVQRQ